MTKPTAGNKQAIRKPARRNTSTISATTTAPVPHRAAVVAPGSRRERNKQDKQQRILGAALALFRAKPFAAVTTQEVAHAAHIAAGTLFLYVTSKEDLLVLVFKDEMAQVVRKTFAGIDRAAPITEQLLRCFAAMKAYHDRDVALSRVLLKELTILSNAARRADVAQLVRLIHGGIADLIETAQRAGQLRGALDARAAAEALFAAYYLGLIGWLGAGLTCAQYERRLRRQIDAIVGWARPAAVAAGTTARPASKRVRVTIARASSAPRTRPRATPDA